MTRTIQVTVFGGTGFLGRYVIDRLADMGVTVRVATRSPASAYFLRTAGTVGQVVPIACNIHDSVSVEQAVHGADWVINLVGILSEKSRKNSFEKIHIEFPERLAAIAARQNIKRLVHVSSLAADLTAPSQYGRTKAQGELTVLKEFPNATILRPSVIFGPEDKFFNHLANIANVSPFMPLIGGGKTLFQPVYVGDVADAVIKALTLETSRVSGQIFELGGNDTYSFNELMEMVLSCTGKQKKLVPVPFGVAKMQGAVLQYLPGQLLTVDQVRGLTVDNVLSGKRPGFAELAIKPQNVEDIVPHYLKRFVSGGRFADREKRVS